MNSPNRYDIAIVGGGIPALFEAVVFSKLELKVLLVAKGFDRKLDSFSEGVFLMPSHLRILAICSLWSFSKCRRTFSKCIY